MSAPAATRRLTRHGHHDRFIDLCGSCDESFDTWLGELGATRDGLPIEIVDLGGVGLGGVGPHPGE